MPGQVPDTSRNVETDLVSPLGDKQARQSSDGEDSLWQSRQMISPSSEVAEALVNSKPVVALESSIIAHGLPFPANIETAMAAEEAVRATSAVPATIAVIDGECRIGLDRAALERLSDPNIEHPKAGARDLAALCADGRTAGTTVSATSHIASRLGIRVFATGGIGGVHRGDPSDVSADLEALARTPIAVVSSGIKSILDIAKTAERLETLGVSVVGFATDELPAFYSRDSGLTVPHRLDSPTAVAAMLAARFDGLGQAGVLIANPVPQEHEIPAAELEPIIEKAIASAKANAVTGKDVTPFLLGAVRDALGARAITTNRELVLANARLAASIAVALSLRLPN